MILFQGRVRTLEGPDEVVKEALLVAGGRIVCVCPRLDLTNQKQFFHQMGDVVG